MGTYIPHWDGTVQIIDTIAEESRAVIATRSSRVIEGKENSPVVMVLLRKDGSRIRSESRSIPIVYDQKPAALIIGRELDGN